MSKNPIRFSYITFSYLLVLISLIYIFHTELFIASIRLYSLLSVSPRTERFLGDYYQSTAQRSSILAYNFYASAMKNYKEQLPLATPKQQAIIKISIGRLYQCGKGIPPNLTEANRWYQEALKEANELNKSNAKLNERIITHLKQEIAATEQGLKKGITPACSYQSDLTFFLHTFDL